MDKVANPWHMARVHLLVFLNSFLDLPRQPPADQPLPQWPCGFSLRDYCDKAYHDWEHSSAYKAVQALFQHPLVPPEGISEDVSDEAFVAFLADVKTFRADVEISASHPIPEGFPANLEEIYHLSLTEKLARFMVHVLKFGPRWTTRTRTVPYYRGETWKADDPVPTYEEVQGFGKPPTYEPPTRVAPACEMAACESSAYGLLGGGSCEGESTSLEWTDDFDRLSIE